MMVAITCLFSFCMFNANVNICNGKWDDEKHRVVFEMTQDEYDELKDKCSQTQKQTEYKQQHLGRYGE